MRRPSGRTAGYAALLTAAFAVAVAASWRYGARVDNYAYDYMYQHYQPAPWQPESVILAIDEPTLSSVGGMGRIRRPLAEALRLVAAAKPKAVAVDVTLTDPGPTPIDDEALAAAFCATPRLVLGSLLMGQPARWEDPNPRFARCAAAIGHFHADPDDNDSVTRAIPLERRAGVTRRWALALEAFRVSRGAEILESPEDLEVGGTSIPVAASSDGRPMRVRFVPEGTTIPTVSMDELLRRPSLAARFADKVIFVGVTAAPAVHDRLFSPYSRGTSTHGIEHNANAFETIVQRWFITDVPQFWVLLFSAGLAVAAGLVFHYLPGWRAYAAGALILLVAQVTPYVFFTHQRVFSFATPASVAWLATVSAAAYYHLVVRRNWLLERSSRERYQQAMHFVTHEMRTPLSAIQGSSELISRYALTEEKRKQVALLINSESKRLARMVEIFLSVERLSAGQMELKRETIPLGEMVELCVERARPLAERKHISMTVAPVPHDLRFSGDRELMQYACYNLLSNAIKYSPQRTDISVSAWQDDGHIRVAVKDQGIGMDQKELKQIFQKFYRTRKAEESGEAGSGIGLSIVQQIVEQHGGKIEVVSQPGAGSCFTLVLPAAHAPVPTAAERH